MDVSRVSSSDTRVSLDGCIHLSPEGERCSDVIAPGDPEKSYCRKHKRYIRVKTKIGIPKASKSTEKYLDYDTFLASLVA